MRSQNLHQYRMSTMQEQGAQWEWECAYQKENRVNLYAYILNTWSSMRWYLNPKSTLGTSLACLDYDCRCIKWNTTLIFSSRQLWGPVKAQRLMLTWNISGPMWILTLLTDSMEIGDWAQYWSQSVMKSGNSEIVMSVCNFQHSKNRFGHRWKKYSN